MHVKENLHLFGKLNEIRVPDDLILSNASLIDVLRVHSGDVSVNEKLIVNGLLNNIPLAPLFNFTLNENSYLGANLRIIGE